MSKALTIPQSSPSSNESVDTNNSAVDDAKIAAAEVKLKETKAELKETKAELKETEIKLDKAKDDLKADPNLATNNQRVLVRPALLETLRRRVADRTADELATLFEAVGLPFAPIRRPEDLYDDPHLKATGGLADIRLPDGPKAGQTVKTTLFPITMQGQRLGVRMDPPRLGQHTLQVLGSIGYEPDQIETLRTQRAVA